MAIKQNIIPMKGTMAQKLYRDARKKGGCM